MEKWTVQVSSPASTAAFPSLRGGFFSRSSPLYLTNTTAGVVACHTRQLNRLLYKYFEKSYKKWSGPHWQNSANNWLHACQLAFWQRAVAGVTGKVMSQIVWTAWVHVVIFLFCRTKYISMVNEQTDFMQVKWKRGMMAESFSEVDSKSLRLGAGRAAHCHLLSLVGAPVGMLPSVCSLCKPGQGRTIPGVRGCPASSTSFGHQLDPSLGKLVLWKSSFTPMKG